MKLYTSLDILAIVLVMMHFGVPLVYYVYLKKRWLSKSWSIRGNPSYLPKITIIVPTYNEARFIVKKLDDIYRQDYPRDRMEIIVIDSASSDGTPELVKKWSEMHRDISLKLVVESARRGKSWALNEALKHVSSDSEIIIVTDVDSWWYSFDTLRKVANLFADPTIGAVSCIKFPVDTAKEIEVSYRSFYNIVRVGESKIWATPVFHGELIAIRKRVLEEIGGFPKDIGADDSYVAAMAALKGYRSIIHDDIICVEAVPRQSYFWWRVRRAQHLVQHFLKLIKAKEISRNCKMVFRIELFLHLINPWILLASVVMLLLSIIRGSLLATTILGIGIALLAIHKVYRMWIYQQLVLIVATIRNLWTKELVWKKEEK